MVEVLGVAVCGADSVAFAEVGPAHGEEGVGGPEGGRRQEEAEAERGRERCNEPGFRHEGKRSRWEGAKVASGRASSAVG